MHAGRSAIPSLVRPGFRATEEIHPQGHSVAFAPSASLAALAQDDVCGIEHWNAASDDRWRGPFSVDGVILSEAKNLSPGMHAGRLAILSPIQRRFDASVTAQAASGEGLHIVFPCLVQ